MSSKKVAQWIEESALLANIEQEEEKVDLDQINEYTEDYDKVDLNNAFTGRNTSLDQKDIFQIELEVKNPRASGAQ